MMELGSVRGAGGAFPEFGGTPKVDPVKAMRQDLDELMKIFNGPHNLAAASRVVQLASEISSIAYDAANKGIFTDSMMDYVNDIDKCADNELSVNYNQYRIYTDCNQLNNELNKEYPR